jgi:hypothetical protein
MGLLPSKEKQKGLQNRSDMDQEYFLDYSRVHFFAAL